MFPEPLHPAVVHFPVVLAVFVPLVAAIGFWAVMSGRLSVRGWTGVIALQVILVVSTWAATESGEKEEDRVEKVVAERHIEEHEEAGERVLALALLTLPVAIAGLIGGPIGVINRGLTIALSLVVLLAAGFAGHSGGELVYRHGATLAYTEGGVTGTGKPIPFVDNERWHHDDDDDDD